MFPWMDSGELIKGKRHKKAEGSISHKLSNERRYRSVQVRKVYSLGLVVVQNNSNIGSRTRVSLTLPEAFTPCP